MKISIPTCIPQGKTLSSNDYWQIGTVMYRTLLFLTQWEWQLFQSFRLSFTLMEQRGQAAPAQMKLLPLFSDTLDLFLEGKIQVSSSTDSHDRWTEDSLKNNLLKIFPWTSLPSMEGEGGRDLPCRKTRKIPSLTCTKLPLGIGWRKGKTGPTILSYTNLDPIYLLKSNLQRFRGKPCSLPGSSATAKSLSACFHESHSVSLATSIFPFSFQSHVRQSQEIRIRCLE